MFYRKLLEYYLTSSEWDFQLIGFFEAFDHHYDPYEGTNHWGRVYLSSEIYREYSRKLDIAGGRFLSSLYLSHAQFQKYFTEQYSEDQRFAALFGIWWGLKSAQVTRIANLRNKKNCLSLLNYYLCNPEADAHVEAAQIQSYHYSGKYYAEIYDSPPERPRTGKPDHIVPATDICNVNFTNLQK